MNTLPVGSAKTIFDWEALREEFRGKLDLLELESLAVMYGLSSTTSYQDDDFVRKVEAYLAKSENPVRTRFDFAYHLASSFWEVYSMWGFVDLTEMPANDRPYRMVKYEYDGPEFYRVDILAGDPGYAGDLVEALHDKVMEWLLEGLSAYADDQEVMEYAFYLVSRIGMWDTFLKEKDIALMEAAAKKEISFKTSAGALKKLRQLIDAFEEQKKNDREKKAD